MFILRWAGISVLVCACVALGAQFMTFSAFSGSMAGRLAASGLDGRGKHSRYVYMVFMHVVTCVRPF